MKKVLLVAAAGLAAGCGEFNANRYAADVCKWEIRDNLRERQGARFRDALVSNRGLTYTVSWSVTARNGFGGMSEQRHTCRVTYEQEPTWSHAPREVVIVR